MTRTGHEPLRARLLALEVDDKGYLQRPGRTPRGCALMWKEWVDSSWANFNHSVWPMKWSQHHLLHRGKPSLLSIALFYSVKKVTSSVDITVGYTLTLFRNCHCCFQMSSCSIFAVVTPHSYQLLKGHQLVWTCITWSPQNGFLSWFHPSVNPVALQGKYSISHLSNKQARTACEVWLASYINTRTAEQKWWTTVKGG